MVLPGLARPGLVAALVEAIEALRKLRPKLNMKKVAPPTDQHPRGEDGHLLVAGVLEHRKHLERYAQLFTGCTCLHPIGSLLYPLKHIKTHFKTTGN